MLHPYIHNPLAYSAIGLWAAACLYCKDTKKSYNMLKKMLIPCLDEWKVES